MNRSTHAWLARAAGVAVIAVGGLALALAVAATSHRHATDSTTLHYRAAGTRAAHHVTLRQAGADYQLVDTTTGRILAARPAADTRAVAVQGAHGSNNADDTFTVDLPEHGLRLAGGIRFDGGRAGFDTLVLTGGSVQRERAEAHSSDSGTITLDGTVIRYSNIEPITDTIPAASFTVEGKVADEIINVIDGAPVTNADCTTPCATTEINSQTGSFEKVTLANKALLIVDGISGGDSLVFANPHPATGLTDVLVRNVATVTQTAALTYQGLALSTTGLVTLTNAGNSVATVAGASGGPFTFVSTVWLFVGSVGSTADHIDGITTSDDNVTLTAGNIAITNPINAGIGRVQVGPRTVKPVAVGVQPANTFGVSDAEVDRITAGALRIGNNVAGDLSITAPITPANTAQLELQTNSGVLDANTAGHDITVSNLGVLANSGIGVSGGDTTLELSVTNLEAESVTGGMNLDNDGPVSIGGLGPSFRGLHEETSGNVLLSTLGTITLNDTNGAESVRGGGTSGNVTLLANGATSDIVSAVNFDVVNASRGNITLTAGRDVLLGTGGSFFDNDLRASGSISLTAGRDVTITNFADISSDDFSQNTGLGISVVGTNVSLSGNDSSLVASGTAGGSIDINVSPGGLFTYQTSAAATTIVAASGSVSINADRALIDSNSGISALAAGKRITIAPTTASRPIDLGSASDLAAALELSDAELDQLKSTLVQVGDNATGDITITAPLTPANATTLSIRTTAALVDGNATEPDVAATGLVLRSGSGIDLATQVSQLAFDGGAGDVSLTNTGGLALAALDGLSTSGTVGSVSITIPDASHIGPNPGDVETALDNLTVPAGVTLRAVGGDIGIFAGDNVAFAPLSILQGGVVTITVDGASADSLGATVTMDATTTATSVAITGGTSGDTFQVTPSANTPISVTGLAPAPPSAGDSLLVRASAAASPALAWSSSVDGYSGTWTFGDRADVTFSQIEGIANWSTITGAVYNDVNGNGTRASGENGIAGVAVELRTPADVVLATTTTASDGTYSFAQVITGTYKVRIVVPTGQTQTSANPANIVAPDQGTTIANITFGTFDLVDLSGTVFHDADGDGVFDSGESGVSGRTVYIDTNGNGVLEGGEVSTTTASNGSYTFTAVGPGTYKIRQALPAGTAQSTLNPADIIPTSGTDVTNVNLGSFNRVSISGTVMRDVDNDGVADAEDPRIGGWIVFIDANNDGKLSAGEQSAVTASDGTYTIAGVGSGTQRLRQVLPSGFTEKARPADVATSSGNNITGANFLVFRVGFPGYALVASDGGVFAFGGTPFHGSLGSLKLNQPIVGMAYTADGGGYWLVAADGGVFAFGNAGFMGSLGSLKLNSPIVGIAALPDGTGYWLVAADGGVFAFGNAPFHGSLGSIKLNQPIAGILPDVNNGYRLFARDGGVFAFGGARFFGSAASIPGKAPIVAMAVDPITSGYWVLAADGSVYAYGTTSHGSMAGTRLVSPMVTIVPTADGTGYWLIAADGGVFAFNAPFAGSLGGLKLNQPIVAGTRAQ
jgi:hypothetical protein